MKFMRFTSATAWFVVILTFGGSAWATGNGAGDIPEHCRNLPDPGAPYHGLYQEPNADEMGAWKQMQIWQCVNKEFESLKNLKWEVKCEDDRIFSDVWFKDRDDDAVINLFMSTDGEMMGRFLEFIRKESRRWCGYMVRIRRAKVVSNTQHIKIEAFYAQLQAGQKVWEIQDNERPRILAEMQKEQAEEAAAHAQEEERLRIYRAVQERRMSFIRENGIQSWPSSEQITANPFRFKGSVVGIKTTFVKMISEGEALFGSGSCFLGICPDALMISDVPSTQFGGGETLILAIKVRGIKVHKTETGEMPIPDITYIASFQCRQNNCTDFFN